MELVFTFAVVEFEILLVDFFEIIKIIGTLGIHAFMNDEMLPVFLGDERVTAVRTAKLHGGEATFIRRETGITNFAEKLSFGAIILIKEGFWSITTGTATAVGDITRRTTTDGKNLLTVAFFVVRDEIFVSPVLPEVSE